MIKQSKVYLNANETTSNNGGVEIINSEGWWNIKTKDYIVKQNDTLYTIAQTELNHISKYAQLMWLNGIIDPFNIETDTIQIPK